MTLDDTMADMVVYAVRLVDANNAAVDGKSKDHLWDRRKMAMVDMANAAGRFAKALLE